MKKELLILPVIFLYLFAGCGPSIEDRARVKMNEAQVLLQQHDTINALIKFDSIQGLFPGAAFTINSARNLKNEIRVEILQRRIAALEAIKKQIPLLEASFTKEKTDYDRYMQYVHNRQIFDKSWDRSYIRVNLDERGDISITSNYFGQQWIDHTGIRVYDQGEQAVTGTVPPGNVDNHHSSFMETKSEQVTYRNESALPVIKFITANSHRKLKAVFLGKGNYYIVLEDNDKQAIKDALLLSEALKRKNALENEVRTLQNKINL
jgi:hypothetical protein